MTDVKKILRKHQLVQRIEMFATREVIGARAFPEPQHPIVEERRKAEYDAITAKGHTSITMTEAEDIAKRVLAQPLCTARGETIEEALANLDAMLKAGK